MKFSFDHNNINVLNLEKSVEFYKNALGFIETRRFHSSDGSFTLVFLGDETTNHKLELTCLKDRTQSYNLGENEFHLAVVTDDFDEAYSYHKKMGCICYENKSMEIYFIIDPDGYWTEVIPRK
ncbi:VOC family protein [Clostridium estertheticum]|uniref:VOC family protein n=1 Tax=Clostridium estertheticum TaxID=238834 RepID=UPI0013EECF70|nr:VOC family protein [Clostridium estertheticum]MBZ9606790.1 VOC family protein [Clostridium estertheticum]